MASVQTSPYGGRYLKLTVIEESYSIDDNTSTLKWTLESIGGSVNYYSIYGCKAVVNGTTVHNSGNTEWDSYMFPASKGSVSGTMIIAHNNDGTADDISFSLTGSVYYNNPITYSGSISLTTIPRASSITVLDANIGSSTNITINKTSSNFTTTLWYKANGQNDWTKIVDKTSNQVYGWVIPTSFYSLIPNSKTISCGFKAETYSNNTLIGEKTTTATFTATGSPIINSSTAIDINSETTNLTGDSSKMIKYASNVKVTISATSQNNSSISSIKVNGYEATNNEITFLNTETNLFAIDVIDSRGYVTSETITMNMIDYIPVKINSYDIDRNQNTDGKIKISYSGVFFNGSFGISVNALIMQYRYKEKNGNFGNWITLTPTISNNSFLQSNLLIDNFDYQKQFEFELKATDVLGNDEILGISIKKGETIFDWDETKFNVNVPIKMKNVDLDNIYLKQVGGTLSGDLTLPNLIVSNTLSSSDGSFSNSLKLNTKDVLTTDDLVLSTNEKAVGKWIDGNTIYRKVMELTTIAGANSFPISDVSSNIDIVTKIDGITIQPNTNHIIPLLYYYNSNDYSNVYITATNIVIRCGNSYGFGATKLILEYTKVNNNA